ncbi:hypothetical protein [Ruficoccus sp. ZRK36]|uniref:hypothetical protein n=1 Tax=Ruficoccus sp. ZRK36 TaxID=2866311 RepID=UPI001C729FB3|nr:hypothetical protein [Ruficoccus sp. ZRK36]QYY37379.1 hypothetical protein K0V07_07805 [Ruficoccus sp. ZRK36]
MTNKLYVYALSTFAAVAGLQAQTVLDQNLPQIDLVGTNYEINADLTLNLAGSPYILEGTTIVTAGHTLTIEPGVIVRGQPEVVENSDIPGSLIVARGATIDAEGTVSDPIIFTTAATPSRTRWTSGAFLDSDPAGSPLPPTDGTNDNVALWGGVVLLGYAPTNLGYNSDTSVSGEGTIEGFGQTGENFTYGGRNPNDSSGTLKYVSIRHTGNSIKEGDEVQGLTIGAVGMGTQLEYIDIYCSSDDGIEIFGGTSALKYIMISYAADDGLDLDQGYCGYIQFAFILGNGLTNSAGGLGPNSLAEWDGDDGSDTIDGAPFAHPTFYNFTFFGTGTASINYEDQIAFRLRNSFGGDLYNSVIAFIPQIDILSIQTQGNTYATGAGYPSPAPSAQVQAGTLNIAGTLWWDVSGNDATAIADSAIGTDILQNNLGGLAPGASNNVVGTNPYFAGSGLVADANDQSATNGLNPVPYVGVSPAPIAYTNVFFDKVDYIGAFENSAEKPLWTTGWTAMNIREVLVDNGNGDTL